MAFEIINNSTGLVLDVVCSGGSKGGISIGGKQDIFFRGVSGVIKVMFMGPVAYCVNHYANIRATLFQFHEEVIRTDHPISLCC